MLKKLIILLTVFAIKNSINCAEAQNANGINYITKITHADLAQMQPGDTCGICLQELLNSTTNLYKSNCPQMFMHPHIFHRDCILGSINSGLPSALNCPICRGQMVDIVALMRASRNGDLETVELLLERGADINIKDYMGNTALMNAIRAGDLEMVELLLERGADINTRNNFEDTVLIYASVNGHLEIVELLLSRGADINARDENGFTPLMAASRDGHLETVELLLSRGADINAREENGFTALRYAFQIANLLIAHGAIV